MGATLRSPGEDAIYFDHEGERCTDPRSHKSCRGRWRGVISLGFDAGGGRVRRQWQTITDTPPTRRRRWQRTTPSSPRPHTAATPVGRTRARHHSRASPARPHTRRPDPEVAQWITDLTERHAAFAQIIADRQNASRAAELDRAADPGQPLLHLAPMWADAILQPPKPAIEPFRPTIGHAWVIDREPRSLRMTDCAAELRRRLREQLIHHLGAVCGMITRATRWRGRRAVPFSGRHRTSENGHASPRKHAPTQLAHIGKIVEPAPAPGAR
jgi:hypothetical protein